MISNLFYLCNWKLCLCQEQKQSTFEIGLRILHGQLQQDISCFWIYLGRKPYNLLCECIFGRQRTLNLSFVLMANQTEPARQKPHLCKNVCVWKTEKNLKKITKPNMKKIKSGEVHLLFIRIVIWMDYLGSSFYSARLTQKKKNQKKKKKSHRLFLRGGLFQLTGVGLVMLFNLGNFIYFKSKIQNTKIQNKKIIIKKEIRVPKVS